MTGLTRVSQKMLKGSIEMRGIAELGDYSLWVCHHEWTLSRYIVISSVVYIHLRITAALKRNASRIRNHIFRGFNMFTFVFSMPSLTNAQRLTGERARFHLRKNTFSLLSLLLLLCFSLSIPLSVHDAVERWGNLSDSWGSHLKQHEGYREARGAAPAQLHLLVHHVVGERL